MGESESQPDWKLQAVVGTYIWLEACLHKEYRPCIGTGQEYWHAHIGGNQQLSNWNNIFTKMFSLNLMIVIIDHVTMLVQ